MALPPRCLAGFFAAPVNLLKQMAHHADEGRAEPRKQHEQRNRAPKGPVGGQTRLKCRRHESHSRREKSEKPQHSGENVEVARHMCGGLKRFALLRFYADRSSAGKLPALHQPYPGQRKLNFHQRH